MEDFLYTVLWVAVYSIPSFLIQLVLCFKVNNRFFRLFPVYILIAGRGCTVDMYFNLSGIHGSWHELSAFITGVYTAVFSLGVLSAFIVYKFYKFYKNRQR